MSYLVLARKWRPQTFDQIVGQEHVNTTLRNAIRTGRIAHAYLFAGSRGVGKTTTARVLAKALNCAEGPTATPCNQCTSCLEITGSRSMDVMEIDGASNRGIDEIRDLRENVKYAPTQGKYKIYIIDEVHMLTKEAFNALLKTLEEPPSHVIFIFATTEIHKVPITILSRCQRFDFRKVETTVIVDYLKQMLQGEQVTAEDDCLYLVAQKAEGSMRDSISLLDQLISYGGQQLTAADARQVLGLVDEALYFRTLELIKAHDQTGMLELVEQVSSGGYDLQEFALGLLGHLRKLMVIAAGQAQIALADVPADAQSRYTDQAQGMDGRDLVRMLGLLIDAESYMKRSSQPRLLLEVACLRLCQLDESVKIDDLLSQMEGGGGSQVQDRPGGYQAASNSAMQSRPQVRTAPATPTPTAMPRPAPVAPETAASMPVSGDFETVWQSLVSSIKGRNMMLGTCLEAARPVGISDGRLVLSFGPKAKFYMESLDNKNNQALVEGEAAKLWGQRLKLACQVSQTADSPQPEPPKRATVRDEADRRKNEAMRSPKLKNFIDQVDGEVL